jgi:hypothetical protein
MEQDSVIVEIVDDEPTAEQIVAYKCFWNLVIARLLSARAFCNLYYLSLRLLEFSCVHALISCLICSQVVPSATVQLPSDRLAS